MLTLSHRNSTTDLPMLRAKYDTTVSRGHFRVTSNFDSFVDSYIADSPASDRVGGDALLRSRSAARNPCTGRVAKRRLPLVVLSTKGGYFAVITPTDSR